MNDSVLINIRINNEIKNQLDKICGDLKISVPDAFDLFIKAMIQKGEFPFDVEAVNSFYSQKKIDYIFEGMKHIENPQTEDKED